MSHDRPNRAGRRPPPAAPGPDPALRRIPLPPLPHFRRPEPPAGAAPDEGALPPRGPEHEGQPPPLLEREGSERTGDIGAAVLNDLVDQIERDLERELGRVIPETTPPTYRATVRCASRSAGGAAGGAGIGRPGNGEPEPPGR
jgi:hypothetical protein